MNCVEYPDSSNNVVEAVKVVNHYLSQANVVVDNIEDEVFLVLAEILLNSTYTVDDIFAFQDSPPLFSVAVYLFIHRTVRAEMKEDLERRGISWPVFRSLPDSQQTSFTLEYFANSTSAVFDLLNLI